MLTSKELKYTARCRLRNYYWQALGITTLVFLVPIVFNYIELYGKIIALQNGVFGSLWEFYTTKAGVSERFRWISFAFWIISPALSLGLNMYNLKIIRGEQAEFNTFLRGFSFFWKALGLMICQGLYILLMSLVFYVVFVVILNVRPPIFLSFTLFILYLSLLIERILSFSMTSFILADKPLLTINKTLRKSIELMKGNRLKLLYLNLSFIGWAILNFITYGISTPFYLSYYLVTLAAFYNEAITLDVINVQT